MRGGRRGGRRAIGGCEAGSLLADVCFTWVMAAEEEATVPAGAVGACGASDWAGACD